MKQHFRDYKEDEGTFRKIGNFMNRPKHRFESKRLASGIQYLVKMQE